MKMISNQVKIAIVDDNDYFNSVLTKQLDSYTEKRSEFNNLQYEIHSYINTNDFARKPTNDFDIIILDFFLGKGFNA